MTIHHKIGLRYPGIAGVVLALLVALSGCQKEVGESGPTGESDGGARHVRIAASIDSYSLPGSRPSTRAVGTVKEVGNGIWKEHAELGLDYESAVYFAVLYIYPEGDPEPSSAWIYYTNAFAAGCKSLKEDKLSPLSKIEDLEELSQNNSQVRHFASTESSALTMDLELEPGNYKFVLVANSIPALTSAIESTTNPADPRGLTSKETAFTSLDLMPNTVTKLPRRFMPMVGSQDFTITSSTAVPQVVSPDIELERTFARLDVCLTTADKDLTAYHEKDGNVPTDFRFLEYSLKGMGGYEQPLFPLESETTAIKEKSSAKVAAPTPSEVVDPKITVESKEGPILLSNIAESFDEKEANTFNTPTKLSTPWAEPIQVSMLWKSPIFRTTTDETEPAGKYYGSFTKDPESASADAKHPAIHLYIPSLYQKKDRKHEVSFTLKFGRATDASQTKEYTISLTNRSDDEDLYAIRRNTWYRYELKFYGEKMRVLGPLTITPQDWSLDEDESLSYDDEYIVLTQDTVTLSANEGAKGKFMILSDQLGSDPKSLTYTFNGKSTPPDWLEMEGKLPTSLNKGESTEIAFHTLSENEDDNDEPRVCELVITPKDYKRPLRVVIRQLPIQYIQARPYVAFVGDKASGPLSTKITVRAHSYDWKAGVVDTYCTAASTGNWLTLKKIDNQTLEISVEPVEARMNILRIGMIKIYDGTNHPAYIRVEQGGYKAIELDNGQVWLDRNMGALSYAHYEQWKGGAVITGFDRVRVNGAFYQTGRVPDGYQYNGMDLLAGNINTSLTAAEKTDLLASRQPRRLGDAPGTGSSSIVSPEEQLPAADPQYHKFIASGARDNWDSELFRNPKWFKLNPGKKREGLDPCPEGYRIPFKNEFKTMIEGDQISIDGTRDGGSQFRKNAMGYFYMSKDQKQSLYIPLGGWRDTDGSLQDWWNVDDATPKAKYAIYNLDSPSLAGYCLLGYDNSMQFFAPPKTKTKTAEGLLVRCIKITDK